MVDYDQRTADIAKFLYGTQGIGGCTSLAKWLNQSRVKLETSVRRAWPKVWLGPMSWLLWRHNGRDDVSNKQRVLMHGHQGWNVRHGLCHIYMIYVYIWVVYTFCFLCCLFIIVTTQFVALYKPCKPKPKPSTYDPPPPPPPPDNHPLAEIQRPILRPEPKQQICHQHANTDHFGK